MRWPTAQTELAAFPTQHRRGGALSLSCWLVGLIYDLEHGKKRSGYRDFGNRPSLEMLATEIDSGPRGSRAKLCALIDVETPLL